MKIEEFVGMTFTHVTQLDDSIHFHAEDGSRYTMEHYQDCCENVYVESIAGDLQDLTDSPILFAEEATSVDTGVKPDLGDSSCTWTFYKLATRKGWVDIRWFGSSNGYYGESVDIRKD